MKKISFVFVAALSLAAFGCKKKGDCDSAINNMMEVSKADMAKGMDDKMMDKMKGIAMSHCKDDKWPDDALKCMKEAKTSADANACQSKIPKDMQEKMTKDMMAAMTAGMEKPPGGEKPAEGSGAAPAGGSAEGGGAAPAGGGGDLPKECADYKAAIEKLASCDKLPQASRDALKQAYDQASAGWANLPAESKAGLATACKAGADAVMQSAKATCGW